jgi:hypothetical protein
MGVPVGSAGKRLVLETLGWLLLVAGCAALFLPGPGLLGIFAGLALLSQQYAWAARWVEPVKLRALRGAAEGVETWPRIVVSLLGVMVLVVCGVVWILSPAAPSWWSLSEAWWLPGGLWTGVTQIASGAIALALIVYSYRRFHGQPSEVDELSQEIEEADRNRASHPDGGADSRSGGRVR